MFFLKFICFLIYTLAVVVFMYYENMFYLYTLYRDWLFVEYKNKSYYDYVVVGAGSAGSILTHYLSRNGESVLLIEAGSIPGYFFDIPIITPLLINSKFDWQYKTVPQKYACKGLQNNQSNWPAGKILGGSSRLNNMVFVEGHSEDYKSWFPDFKEICIKNGNPLFTDKPNWYSELSDAVLQGVSEITESYPNTHNATLSDFEKVHLTIKRGERWSTDRLIYNYNSDRLTVMINALVTKILFNSNKAVGVEILRHDEIYVAYARKGVILSAGAIGSPKLLMLSGIGPKHHLQKHNIKTVVDLPVGQNLVDHIITGLDLVILNQMAALSIIDVVNPYSTVHYWLFRKGPWTSSGIDVIGSIYNSLQTNRSAPNLQIMVLPTGLSQDNGRVLRKNLGISDKIYSDYFAPLTYQTAITIAPVLLHPKSSGEVRLKSSNPLDAPVIDPKYLSNEEDVLMLIEGIKFIKELIQTKAMERFGAELYKKPFPGCESFVFDTTDYWKCYVRHLTLTTYHPVGTCSMGKVVDSKFRVYKTKNLFVVDASVFPKLPSGNINAPVVKLAKKASSLLLKDLTNRNSRSSAEGKCYQSDIFF